MVLLMNIYKLLGVGEDNVAKNYYQVGNHSLSHLKYKVSHCNAKENFPLQLQHQIRYCHKTIRNLFLVYVKVPELQNLSVNQAHAQSSHTKTSNDNFNVV